MPIKTLGSLGKIRVGQITGNTNIFWFCLRGTYNTCFEQKLEKKFKKNRLKIANFTPFKIRSILHRRVTVMSRRQCGIVRFSWL